MKETRRFTSKIILSATICFCCCFQFLQPVLASNTGNSSVVNGIYCTVSESTSVVDTYSSGTLYQHTVTDIYFSFSEACTGSCVLLLENALNDYEYTFVGCAKTSYSVTNKSLTLRWSDTNCFYVRCISISANTNVWQSHSNYTDRSWSASSSDAIVIPVNNYQIPCYQVFTKFGLTNNVSKPYMLGGTFGSVDSNLVGIAPTQTIYFDFYSSRSIWEDYSSGETDTTPISTSDSNIVYSIRNIDIVATSDGAYFYHVVFTSNSSNILYFYFNIDTFIGADVDIYPIYFGLNTYFPDDLKYMIGDTTEQGVANTWLYMIYTQMLADSGKMDDLNDKVDDLNTNITTINDNITTFNNDFNTAVDNMPLQDISDGLINLNTKANIFVNFIDTFYNSLDSRIQLVFLLPLMLGVIAFFIGRG